LLERFLLSCGFQVIHGEFLTSWLICDMYHLEIEVKNWLAGNSIAAGEEAINQFVLMD